MIARDLLSYVATCALALVLGLAVLSDGVIKPVSEILNFTADHIRSASR